MGKSLWISRPNHRALSSVLFSFFSLYVGTYWIDQNPSCLMDSYVFWDVRRKFFDFILTACCCCCSYGCSWYLYEMFVLGVSFFNLVHVFLYDCYFLVDLLVFEGFSIWVIWVLMIWFICEFIPFFLSWLYGLLGWLLIGKWKKESGE